MQPLEIAAMDPLFYAHHCNMDRFWVAWWDHYQGRPNFETQWPNEAWYFYDVDENGLVEVHPEQFMDVMLLGYYYKPSGIPILDLKGTDALTATAPLRFTDQAVNAVVSFLHLVAARIGIPDEILAAVSRLVQLAGSQLRALVDARPIQTLIAAILQRFPHLAIPARITFQSPEIQPGVRYELKLGAGDQLTVFGSLSVLSHSHPDQCDVSGSLTLQAVSDLWTVITQGGLTLTMSHGDQSEPIRDGIHLTILLPSPDDIPQFLGIQ